MEGLGTAAGWFSIAVMIIVLTGEPSIAEQIAAYIGRM